MKKVEWEYDQRYFIKQAALNGNSLSVYSLIDDFCFENNCMPTVFDTIVCDEDQFLMIKLTYPDVVASKIHDNVSWAIPYKQAT